MNSSPEIPKRTTIIVTILRLLLGVMMGASGAVFFLNLTPPLDLPAPAMNFFGALAATGYFLPFLKATELTVGLALLANRFVPLALVVLAPITVNIVLYHFFLVPSDLAVALLLPALHLALAWFYRERFREILRAK